MTKPSENSTSAVVKLYSDRFEKLGDCAESVGWPTTTTQEMRFAELIGSEDLYGQSIIDLGCGLGHLLKWLYETGHTNFNYLGVDVTPGFIEFATQKYNLPMAEFLLADIKEMTIPNADFVLASGAFSYRPAWNQDSALNTVEKMFKSSRKRTSFNMLDINSEVHLDKNYYFDPIEILREVRKISKKVRLHTDYLSNEFTIHIYK